MSKLLYRQNLNHGLTNMSSIQTLFSDTNQAKIRQLFQNSPSNCLITARTDTELSLARDYLTQLCQQAHQLVLPTSPDATNKIKIDAARAIIEKTLTTINQKRWFFINQAETMTTAAQNSLLKLLEEPNQGIQLVLFSTRPNQILITVRSRVQTVKLNPLNPAALKTFISTNYPQIKPTLLNQLLFLAQDDLPLLLTLLDNQQLAEEHINIATDARALINTPLDRSLLIVKNYFASRDRAIILARSVLKIYQTLLAKQASTQHLPKTTKWLACLKRLQQNCSVKLSLIQAIL